MKKGLYIGLYLGFYAFSGKVFAQLPAAPQSLTSPNAAAFGLYGEYPVSHYTGTPEIDIPLHALKSGKADMPISLQYHASGFRPDMHPGWVGMGWNLFAGGAVSRVVRDMPDEYNNANLTYGANNGFYYNHGVLNVSNWNTTAYMQSIARSLANSTKDTEPDEFSFFVNGLSGTFYISHDGSWKVRSNRPIKVEFDGSFLSVPFPPPSESAYTYLGYYKSFSGFTITDENGIRYTFGGNTSAIEYSMEFFNQFSNHWIATTWYLTSVDYGFGDFVGLTYERDAFINQMFISVNNPISTKKVVTGGLQNICGGQFFSINQSYHGMLISPVYLTKINSKHEDIHFIRSTSTELRYPQSAYSYVYSQWQTYSPTSSFLPFLEDNDMVNTYPTNLNKLQWKKLDQIRIEVDGELKKAYNFTYSSSSTQRLTLLSIQETGSDGGTLKPYTFTYNSSVTLPVYLANKNDHWGFYNGTEAVISNTSTYYMDYYNYRQPNATYLQAGSLNRITYPTGGITDFTFEPHQYRTEVPEMRWNPPVTLASNTLAGGLRIRKISSYDPEFPSSKIEKEYFYVKNYTNTSDVSTLPSSGVLSGKSQYYFPDYRLRSFGDNSIYSIAFFTSQSVSSTSSNILGTHVGYTEVAEKRNDGSYTVYDYINFDGLFGQRDQAPLARLQVNHIILEPFTSKVHQRAVPEVEHIFNTSNTAVKLSSFLYSEINPSVEHVRALHARHGYLCNSQPVEEGTAYLNYTNAYLPASEWVYDYDESDGVSNVSTIRSYTYDTSYKLLKQEQATDSRGQIMRTKYRYAFDVLTNYSSTYNNAQLYPYSYLVYSHNIATPIEVVNTVVEGGTEKITAVGVLTHTGTRQYYYPSYQWRSVPQISHKLGNLQPVALSGYVPFSVTRSGSSEVVTLDPAMVKDAEYEFQPSRTYNKIRPVGQIDAAGKVNSTIHGQFMKHPIARISGGRFLESAYASFETTANDSDWRGGGGQVLTRYSDQDAPVGMYCTNNTGTSGYITTYDKQLIAGNTYVLTFWEKGGTVAIRNIGAVTVSNMLLQTKGSWQQREIRLRNVSGNLEIIPAGYLDDVRLYPLGAQMESYTYNQLGGMTTSTDSKGYTTYYEYDQFNRLLRVKDRQGQILKEYTYNIK